MKPVSDCHIHTISSGHAYSTVTECAAAAAEAGLELIAITDHAPGMPGSPHLFHFFNMKVLPKHLFGVRVLRGVEVNILDTHGRLDLGEEILPLLEIVIASLHQPCYPVGSAKDNTLAVIGAMSSPYVHILGHPDDSRMPLLPDEVARAAAATGTLLELNNSSLMPIAFRENADRNIRILLEAAQKHGARLIVDSDAHYHGDVGNFQKVLPLLAEEKVPESMIANISVERLLSWLKPV